MNKVTSLKLCDKYKTRNRLFRDLQVERTSVYPKILSFAAGSHICAQSSVGYE
jgi:hypothetical protein